MPITVTVEDGTPVANANSYISVADADAFLANDPFVTDWAALSADVKGQYLIKARQILDARVTWKGARTYVEQLLAWPRSDVIDGDGVEIEDDVIPLKVAQAQAQLAAYLKTNGDPDAANETQGFKKIKAGSVELEIDKDDRANSLPDAILALVADLGVGNEGGFQQVKLART